MKLITRDKYLDEIRPFIGKGIIKVLTGLRRVRKTTLMLQLAELIRQEDVKSQIIFINKELNEFSHLKTSDALYRFVKTKISKQTKPYLFVDEVQEIDHFELALRQLFAEGIDLYITGSNARLLSGDLATHLSGRYIEFNIHSLSYNEFLEFHGLGDNNDALNKYMRYGGMPYLVHLPMNDEIIYGYLRSIYNTIILKDIVSRYNIRDVDFLDRLTEYLSDYLGNYVSSKKISDFLKNQRVTLSVNTVMNYLKYLAASFFISKAQRLDIIGKRRFEINDKYYFEDLGLKHALLPQSAEQTGSVFENLVYHQLKYENHEVFIGKYHDREIDFVARKEGVTRYIQVSYLLADEKVKEREFGNLLQIRDNFEKIVVSADEFTSGHKGIRHIHIRNFLSGKY